MHDWRNQHDELNKSSDKTIKILRLQDDSPLHRWLADEPFSGPIGLQHCIRNFLAKNSTTLQANQLRALMRQTITGLSEEVNRSIQINQ